MLQTYSYSKTNDLLGRYSMILRKVRIINYRQLQDIELEMRDSLTVLVGPNNSGKTTLISVLKGIFSDKKLRMSDGDIPITLSSAWIDKVLPLFQKVMLDQDRETGVMEIVTQMTSEESDYRLENFCAEIQVDYDPLNDKIQYFADYLMDLDEAQHSFYFIYTYEFSPIAFEKALSNHYDKMKIRFSDINSPDGVEKDTKFYFLKAELLKLYCDALAEKCYFCNANYECRNPMEVSAFKDLFNFQTIPAIRELDDNESDSSRGISKRVISLLKNNPTWIEATKKLPDLLMNDIESSGAKAEIKNSSIKSLDDTVNNISRTSGGYIGKLQLEMDVNEQDIEDFIQHITRAKYDVNGLLLNEESQGLGFSNLIYLHMRLEEFYRSIDNDKVNVFFIEEPESHMHPQMQMVFIHFLRDYYINKKLQGLITTHSNEIARTIGLEGLRVIRQTEKSKSELFDLSKFRKAIKDQKAKTIDSESEFLLENFFDWFFEIGYSELVFADKAVLYEGDSERLYIRKLLRLPIFSNLQGSYIAFIQVGGAYAHNYLSILKMLKMKSLIITDLDYSKGTRSLEEIETSTSTNATINYCYKLKKEANSDDIPLIKELYEFQENNEIELYNGLVYLTFQDKDSTARTLEEAMLNKLLRYNVFKKIKRSEWKKIRKDNKLTFTIPYNKTDEVDSEYSIREIVNATSNNKTDFMYSVVMSGNGEKMLPDYIKKGLLWLAKSK